MEDADIRQEGEMQLMGCLFPLSLNTLNPTLSESFHFHCLSQRAVVQSSLVHTLTPVWHEELILDHILAIVSQHPEPDLAVGLLTHLVTTVLTRGTGGPRVMTHTDLDTLDICVTGVILLHEFYLT